MSTEKYGFKSYQRILASVLCFLVVFLSLSCINDFSIVGAAGGTTFSVSPEYSSSNTLSTKLITITASGSAFSPGAAYPRIYKDGVLQDVTFTNVQSTATQLSFKIASTLSNGTYSVNIIGPTGYNYTNAVTFVVADATVSGSIPLVKILKGYNTQQTVTITGQYSNFSLGQTTVEILSGSTLIDTATVTAVDTTTQQLAFTVNTGLDTGDYNLRITTGSEVINVTNGLKVYGSQSISLSSASLTSSYTAGTTITVTGTNTLFSDSKTTVKILNGNGEDQSKVGSMAVINATGLTFSVNSGLTAGTYTVQVATTGTSESAPTSTLTISQPTAVLKKSSTTITQFGAYYPNLSLQIVGSGTGFQSGSTTLSVFNASDEVLTGKISGTPTVSGQTISFTLAGGASAIAPGSYKFKAITNTEVVEVPFTVVAPALSSLKYNSTVVDASGSRPILACGYKAFTVDVTGSDTHFSNNTTVKIIRGADTVTAAVTYLSSTSISFTIPEDGKITTGTNYAVTIDSDGDDSTTNDILTSYFDVAAQAAIKSIVPDEVFRVSTDPVTIVVEGENTHFTAASGSPTVDITGVSGESISTVTVISDTALTFVLAPNTISELGTYGISVTTNNPSVINETISGSNLLTVGNQGFTNESSVVYTLGLASAIVRLKAVNLTLSGSATVTVNDGTAERQVAGPTIDTNNGTITFNLPSEVVAKGAGTYAIAVNNNGSTYTTSISVVQSYINSYTPIYKTLGYSNQSVTISGNNTVTFTTGNVPAVAIKQGTTTVQTVASSGVSVNQTDNKITFNIPAGLTVGNYTFELSWASGTYSGSQLAVTGSFEIKHEISSLALTYSGEDAGSSVTTYLNKGSISLAAIGTKAQESGTVDRTSTGAAWSSSNASVVTVSNGTVTIVGAGTATVTAAWDGQSDSVEVIVSGPSSIDVTAISSTAALGGQPQLTATASYADSSTQDVTSLAVWESGNTSKATVTASGLVTAKESGQVTVTSTFASRSATFNLNVSSMALSPATINTIGLTPSRAVTVTGIDTSSGVGGITVTLNGVDKTSSIAAVAGSSSSFTFIPGVNPAGTYTVAVTKNGITYNKTLTISQSSITPSIATLLGGYGTFTMSISGSNLTFDSSARKPAVTIVGYGDISSTAVTVDETSNKVKFAFPAGLAAGSHTIRLSWSNETYSGQLETNITVSDSTVASLKIFKDGSEVTGQLSISENELTQLSLRAFDGADTEIGDITSIAVWASDDENAATVNDDGLVTGIGEGTAIITASYSGLSDTVTFSVTGIPTPTVNSFSTAGATLAEGSITGSIVITGTNFSTTASSNTVKIIDNTTGNVTATAQVTTSTATSIAAAIPTGLTQGTYKVRVTVYGKSGTSTGTFTITAPVATPTPTATPVSPGGGGGGGGGGAIIIDPELLVTPSPIPTPSPISDDRKDIISYSADKIQEKLAEIEGAKGKQIRITLAEGEKDVKELSLDSDAIGLLLKEKVDMKIESDAVELEIPIEIFKEFAGLGAKIDVGIIDNDQKTELINSIPDSSKKNMTVLGPVVELQIWTVNGTTQNYVNKFKKKIKIEMDISGLDLKQVNQKRLGVYYLNEAAKTWEFVGGKYNAATGKMEAKTNHFTKFTVIEYKKSFADVASNSWAKEYIEMLAARQITQGIDENNFAPQGLVTRAQFATFLVKALGIETGSYKGKFSDVSEGKWYTFYIEAAESSGLVSGTGNGTFSPDANITREQMAVMVMNAYKYMTDKNIVDEAKKSKGRFNDEKKFSGWAKDAIYAAEANGIISGMPGNVYSPSDNAKREQAARVIIGLLELLGEV